MTSAPHSPSTATSPRTLLSLAGAQPQLARWSQATLLIIDAQNEYRTGSLPLSEIEPAVARLERLTHQARLAGAPVIHVAQIGRPGGLFDPEGDNGAFMTEVTPRSDEQVVNKRLPNAFAGTELEAMLQRTGRAQLIIAGFMTHMCVSATARSALDHGCNSFVVADATATRSLPDPVGGGVIAAMDVQRIALAEIADRYAQIIKVDNISS